MNETTHAMSSWRVAMQLVGFSAWIFGVHSAHIATPVASQPAAVVVATVPANIPSAPVSERTNNASSTAITASATTTVIKQYITQPVIERIVEKQGSVLGASTDSTNAKLSDLQTQIDLLKHSPQPVFVPSFSGPAAITPVSTQTFATSQKIDHLDGVTITNSTVNGVSEFNGGAGSPGGSDGQIQFNDGGRFGGGADVTHDATTTDFGILNNSYAPLTIRGAYTVLEAQMHFQGRASK